jgi:hypothetical protein
MTTVIDEKTRLSWHTTVYLITLAFGAGILAQQLHSIDGRLTRIENYIDNSKKISDANHDVVQSSGNTLIVRR